MRQKKNVTNEGSVSDGGVHFHIGAVDVRFSADGFAVVS